MKTRALPGLGLLALLTVGGLLAAEPAATKYPTVKMGMTTDEVVALVGKPDFITPVEVAGKKTESWTYRRLLDHKHQFDSVDVIEIPAFIGIGWNTLGSYPEDVLRKTQVQIIQVTSLLMVDDHLVASKQWKEKKAAYDQ